MNALTGSGMNRSGWSASIDGTWGTSIAGTPVLKETN